MWCQLPGRFGRGDSGLRLGAMVQCAKMGNRGSPDSELNGWDCEGRKVGGQTKNPAMAHRLGLTVNVRIRTARGTHVQPIAYGKAALLAMLS